MVRNSWENPIDDFVLDYVVTEVFVVQYSEKRILIIRMDVERMVNGRQKLISVIDN